MELNLNNKKIDRNIPLTPIGAGRWAWFFYKAQKGDSVLLNEEEEHSCRQSASKAGFKVSRRKQKSENGSVTYRVWFMGPLKKKNA